MQYIEDKVITNKVHLPSAPQKAPKIIGAFFMHCLNLVLSLRFNESVILLKDICNCTEIRPVYFCGRKQKQVCIGN